MSSKPAVAWKRPQTARYVVSVDNQAKSAFDSVEAANAEAKRISDGFPKVVVRVADSERDSVTMLDIDVAADEPALAAEEPTAE